ncbi:MAG: hypothetical protein NW224_30720 [Leptolyngbyaceae cyanobacterium bins.302]|nr:hypothetical protein [Leptolyngbyaceae cyanobacterium bins.302]
MLQHLLLDPTYGYLYPHRHAVAAFGLPNDYQLSKHRPRLTEGQHWHKIRGVDHIDRVFYSLPGLELLTQLIATPQAQAFWQSLSQHTQPGGALVQIQPASLYTEPEPLAATTEPAPSVDTTPDNPAYALAQYLSPEIQQVVNNALAATTPAAQPLTPQDTAALIFKAQEVVGDQIAKAQASQPRNTTTITIWQQWDNWLTTQDSIAIAILYALLICLTGFGSYLLIAASLQQNSAPAYQPQAETVWK